MAATILVVDDEPNVTQSLRRALRGADLEVLEAQSGREALEILGRRSVDVVISDEQMPGMTGSELLARVRQLYPETIRIVLTGQGTLDAAVKAINEGEIYRFLMKPCPAVELVVTIRQALKQRALLLESRRLLTLFREQNSLLGRLEEDYPDIAGMRQEQDGTIVISGADLDFDAVLGEIDTELGRHRGRFKAAKG